MKSYEKGRLPQIVFGSKKADEIASYLKKYEVRKCLVVSDKGMIKHKITEKIVAILKKEKISVHIFDEVLPEPSDKLCIELANQIKKGTV